MSDDNVIQFKPSLTSPDAKPEFERRGWNHKRCEHKGATFIVDTHASSVECSICKNPVEAIAVLNILLDYEESRARKDNADAYHRAYAEELAEKQAAKTRKAAYATLYRFGITPEMYAEEYRNKIQLGELELKQDYSKTLNFDAKTS